MQVLKQSVATARNYNKAKPQELNRHVKWNNFNSEFIIISLPHTPVKEKERERYHIHPL